MREITVNVGVCVRPDGGGGGHNWDRSSLNAAKQLFSKPIKIGNFEEPYTVKVNPIPVPKGFTMTMIDRKPVVSPAEPMNPAKESDLQRERGKFDFKFGSDSLAGIDLLYVPGAAAATPTQASNRFGMRPDDARKTAEALSRDSFEKALIDKAMTLGIPVLAVCAGSWRLLEAFGGSIRELTSEEVVKHHLTAFDVTEINETFTGSALKEAKKNRGDEMLSAARAKYGPDASSWSLSHQLRVHDVPGGAIRDSAVAAARTLLRTSGSLQGNNVVLEGSNSTHWAVGNATASTRLQAGTIAKRTYAPTTGPNDQRDPSKLLQVVASDPDTGTMEGFETIHGVPMVGAQWHPEGYLDGQPGNDMPYTKPGIVNFSRNLFHYMVLAAVTSKLHKANVVAVLRDGVARKPLKHVRTEERNYRDDVPGAGHVR